MEDEVKVLEKPYSQMMLEVVQGGSHHGRYVTTQFGSTVCDFYFMSDVGGKKRTVNHLADEAEGNADRMVVCWNAFERYGIKDPEGFMQMTTYPIGQDTMPYIRKRRD